MAGLLGMGGLGALGGMTPPAGLLGPAYDPRQMKNAMLKRGLLQTGIGLMRTGNVGDAFASGLEGADAARTGYMQDAFTMAQLEEKNRAQQEADKKAAAVQKVLDGLDPKMRAYADADPDGFFKMYGKTLFPDTEGGDEYGLQPIITQDKDGKYHLFQASKSGAAPKEIPLPYNWTPRQQFLDTGTGYQPMPVQGAPSPQAQQIPKDIVGQQSLEEVGTNLGKKIAAAPNDIAAADNALGIIESLRNDPNKARGTGMSSVFNVFPGTSGRSFQRKVDQATAGAFMTGIQAMRGMGALSDAEGKRASDAVARMDTSTTEEEFDSALNDYEEIVRKGRARAEAFLQKAPAGSVPNNVIPQGVDPELWGVMTPEERALWQN